MRGSINVRLFVIGVLTLLLLIPSAFVGALIQEREGRRAEAIQEVGGRWGAPQAIAGPILHVPFKRYVKDEKNETRTVMDLATFLPSKLEVEGTLAAEVRRRGIYDVALYRAALRCTGRFDACQIDEQSVPAADVLWDRAFVVIGLSDNRGIEERLSLEWNGARLGLQPGVSSSTALQSGVHAPIARAAAGGTFAFDLPLRGHDRLAFVPVAASTQVHLRSSWASPAYTGAFLPRRHTRSAAGFDATWNVLDLNRNFPQQWLGAGVALQPAEFAVELNQPADTYQKTDRAHKYAILIIAMTFVTLFFIEMLKNERIQALNYVLSGLALCLFYVLLLSLSEHIGFDLAYLSAALATTALITWHARNVLAQPRLARPLATTLLTLYGFMFVLLQLQDFALLAGAIGLFAMLAAVMWASSRIHRPE